MCLLITPPLAVMICFADSLGNIFFSSWILDVLFTLDFLDWDLPLLNKLRPFNVLRIYMLLMNDNVGIDISAWKDACWHPTYLSRIHSSINCIGVKASLSRFGQLLHLSVMCITLVMWVIIYWVLTYELAMIIITNGVKRMIVAMSLLISRMLVVKTWPWLMNN